MPKQTNVQIISPGVTEMSGLAASISGSPGGIGGCLVRQHQARQGRRERSGRSARTRLRTPHRAACWRARRRRMSPGGPLNQHVRQDRAEQAVEDDGLGEREAEPLDPLELAAELGLAGDRLDHRGEDVADADTGAERAEADAESEADRLP